MRTRAECEDLVRLLAEEGVKRLNFTVYGLEDYHDAFAGRRGDFALLRRETAPEKLFLFVPHEEGRGRVLEPIRFSEKDFEKLSPEARSLLNRELYRPEREWLAERALLPETRRSLLLSLRPDNIERYESMTPGEILAETEALDEAYYAAFPPLPELAERYGDAESGRFYRQRDLFAHYRRLFAAEHPVSVYDVTDERQSGSRRY